MPSGADNVLTIHTTDGTERLRIDSSGNVKVGSAATISQDGDVFFTGVCTATTLSGAASGLTGALPAISAANLTNIPAANVTGTLPAISAANLTNIPAANVTGTLPAISAANLTNVPAANVVGVHTSLNITGATVVGSAVTISESGIEASGIGITCANINGTQIGGRRNLVINGAMNIAQRGTSSTTAGMYTVDRFTYAWNGHDEALTQAQVDVSSGTTPYTEGFRKAYKVTNGNQTSGAGASDILYFEHHMEAQDIANSGWNYTSSTSFITLSFWVKSSVSQDFKGYVRTPDGSSHSYAYSTGTLSANTWTKIVKTIPGNSNLTIDNDTGQGFQIYLWPYIGTTYTDAGVTENAWTSYSGSARTPVSATDWWTTNDATFEITGVQLEVGSQTTPFEHRTFAEELLLCQRYFQVLGGSNGTYDSMSTGSCASSTVAYVPHRLTHTMRSTPSFTLVGSASDFRYTKGGDQTPSGLTLDQAGKNMVAVRVSAASDHLGTDDAMRLFNINTTGAFQFSAEL